MNIKVYLVCTALFLLGCQGGDNQYNDWRIYRGGTEGNSYSSLRQIDTNNVAKLKLAWTFHTGDTGVTIECNPIVVNDVMFITSPALKAMALNAVTGKLIWRFDPFKNGNAKGVNRGVTYWQDGKDKRIYFSAGHNLYALNAETGLLVTSFGNKG